MVSGFVVFAGTALGGLKQWSGGRVKKVDAVCFFSPNSKLRVAELFYIYPGPPSRPSPPRQLLPSLYPPAPEQTLEQQLEEMRATYQLNTEKLEYNYRVLTERDMENSATLSHQKRKLTKLKDALSGLVQVGGTVSRGGAQTFRHCRFRRSQPPPFCIFDDAPVDG